MDISFLEVLKLHGPWVAMCVFFVWQSWVREGKLGEQLSKSEEFIRVSLATVVSDNTDAWMRFRDILKERPCLIPDADKITEWKHK